MPQVVQRRLQIVIDESGADDALKKLRASAEKLEKEIEKGTKAGRDMAEQIGKLGTTKGRIDELSQVVSGKMAPSFRQAQAAVSNLRKELERMSSDNPKYAATFDRFKQAGRVFDDMKNKVTGFRAASDGLFSKIGTIAAGVGIGNGFTFAIQKVQEFAALAISTSARVSDELANIQKVSGLSAKGVAQLNDELKKIDTRTSSSALRDIAVALGQAGEAVTAANVKALDLINVALGDEFAGGAAEISSVLQVLRNNLGDIKTEDFGTDVTKIANAINELGAKGLATGPVVTDIANRIAGIAQTFGVTSGQILGVAASFQELGINTERGSTAYTKLLQKMASDTDQFAKVAGVSTQEFADLVNKDINQALLLVAENSQKAGTSNKDFAQILNDLGAEGAGVGEILSKLGKNSDLVREKIDLASQSLQSTSSILNEFGVKNETIGAQLDKLGKKFTDTFDNSSLRTGISSLLQKFLDLAEGGNQLNKEFERSEQQYKAVDQRLDELLPEYDKLQQKTSLNNEEQQRLREVIAEIVDLVPTAAGEIDKYGNILAINRDKVAEFALTNQAFLQELEFDTIDSLQDDLESYYSSRISLQRAAETEAASGRDQQARVERQKRAEIEVELVKTVELLKNKYGVEIPKTISDAYDDIMNRGKSRAQIFSEQLDREYKELFGKERGQGKDDKKDIEEVKAPTFSPTKTARKAGKTAAQIEAERRKKELEALAKELQKIEEDLFLNTLAPYEKRLAQIAGRYEQLFTKAGGDIQLRDQVLRAMLEDVRQFNLEFNKAITDAEFKPPADFDKDYDATKKSADLLQAAEVEKRVKQGIQDEIDKSQIDVLNTTANYEAFATLKRLQAKQDAERKALALEKQEAIKAAIEKGESVALVEARYREKDKALTAQSISDKVMLFAQYFQQGLALAQNASDILGSFEQSRINRLTEGYERDKAALDARLQGKLISERDYHAQSQVLENKYQRQKAEIAKKEFKRNQALQIGQALANGAMAVVSTLAARPGTTDIASLGLIRAIQVGLVVAATAAQVAKIASQKPPTGYAKGGILPQGSSHAEGGIALIDNRSGRHVGEIEGGEPIISRKVYHANKGVVDALLNKGWQQDASPLPNWYTQRHATLNYDAFSKRFGQGGTRQKFADGGILPDAQTGGYSDIQMAISQQLGSMIQVNAALLQRLNEPIRTTLIYGEYENTGDAINNIRQSGMIS